MMWMCIVTVLAGFVEPYLTSTPIFKVDREKPKGFNFEHGIFVQGSFTNGRYAYRYVIDDSVNSGSGEINNIGTHVGYSFNIEYNLTPGSIREFFAPITAPDVFIGMDCNLGIVANYCSTCYNSSNLSNYAFLDPYVMIGPVKLGFAYYAIPFRNKTENIFFDIGVRIYTKDYILLISVLMLNRYEHDLFYMVDQLISGHDRYIIIDANISYKKFFVEFGISKLNYFNYHGAGYTTKSTLSPYMGISYSLKGGGK